MIKSYFIIIKPDFSHVIHGFPSEVQKIRHTLQRISSRVLILTMNCVKRAVTTLFWHKIWQVPSGKYGTDIVNKSGGHVGGSSKQSPRESRKGTRKPGNAGKNVCPQISLDHPTPTEDRQGHEGRAQVGRSLTCRKPSLENSEHWHTKLQNVVQHWKMYFLSGTRGHIDLFSKHTTTSITQPTKLPLVGLSPFLFAMSAAQEVT